MNTTHENNKANNVNLRSALRVVCDIRSDRVFGDEIVIATTDTCELVLSKFTLRTNGRRVNTWAFAARLGRRTSDGCFAGGFAAMRGATLAEARIRFAAMASRHG